MEEKVLVKFKVRDGKVEEAREAIRELMGWIRENEPGTLYYASLEDREKPRKFYHYMVFSDREAHRRHRDTAYVQEFLRKLQPLCKSEPTVIHLDEVALCGSLFTDRKPAQKA